MNTVINANQAEKKSPLALDLQGLHLIEASAGTGKTFTLSALMVRILTEKYLPRQVIATTFTRAAAAELKARIRLRLQDMQRSVTEWLLLDPSQYTDYKKTLKDELDQIIFEKFTLVKSEKNHDLTYLDNRLKLVIDSLDELFVGTIDSFTQKLLREFSFESGEILPRQLTEKEKQYPYQIVHDVLRAWLMQQPQEIVDLLLLSKSLKDTDSYVKTVSQTLNFSQAKIQEVECPIVKVAEFQKLAEQLRNFESNTEDLKPYQEDGELYGCLTDANKKNGVILKCCEAIFPKWKKYFNASGVYFLFEDTKEKSELKLSKEVQKLGINLFSTSKKIIEGFFKEEIKQHSKKQGVKPTEWLNENIEQYTQAYLKEVSKPLMKHGLAPLLIDFFKCFDQLKENLKQLDLYLRYYLSVEVKKRLPETLLQAGETTFNQQTRTLREALEGEKGQQFAKAVLQRYPMILVDEFQDTSQEQDSILATIWRDATRLKEGCFIAVGDPKQAIYGFRGGDTLTYNNASADILKKNGQKHALNKNYRSVKNLVEVVDALFLREIKFGEFIEYPQAFSGNTTLKPLIHQGKLDTQPLKLIQLQQDDSEDYMVAQKIRELLVKGQRKQLNYINPQGEEQGIQAEDIAVLAYSQSELDHVQHQLERMNIQVNRAMLNSVFNSIDAQDIGAILQAIVQPESESKLKRALLSPAIGLDLVKFKYFEQHPEEFSQHIQNFRHTRQLWQNKGFLLAWQWFSETYQIWTTLAKNKSKQAERSIVNTRHLIELLSQYSYRYQGIQHLLHWYQLQLSNPQQREWELERKLSGAKGVQLMTIHKSKGLEFKIVFLMNANKQIKVNQAKDSNLGFFDQTYNQKIERVIAINPKLIEKDKEAYDKHQDKLRAENRRLWYVALTRASYAIYLVFKEITQKTGEIGAADFWLKSEGDLFSHQGFVQEKISLVHQEYHPDLDAQIQLHAIPYPKTIFYPKSRTSFSYLAVHQHHKPILDSLAEYNPLEQGASDEQDSPITSLNFAINHNVEYTQPLSWIQQYFPKGAKAGNCLHSLLEDIDFQNPARWEREIHKKLSMEGMWQPLISIYQQHHGAELDLEDVKKDLKIHIMIWLEQIVNTPMHKDDFCLKDLSGDHRLSEFEFYLTLANERFSSEQLHQLFKDYGYEMPEFEQAKSARYLNGAIDLTYFDGQKFHIADYKSNYLGDDLADYDAEHIAHSMTQASYWLQAGIYLVALHRHLNVSLQGYDPYQHLGGANYLYLRGMQAKMGYGVQHWQPSIEFILELDQRLGQHLSLNITTA